MRTLIAGKKKTGWDLVAHVLSVPRKRKVEKNLSDLDKISKEGDTLVVPGKVLGKGTVGKRIRVYAFAFSAEALRKLKESKCEVLLIEEAMQKNPKYEGVKLVQ